MGTPDQSDLYCAAYGNGTFIVRGFGPAPFQMNGGQGAASEAVHKAEGRGQPVSQDIMLSAKGNQVECSINGTVVATHDKSALVTNGKLKSTDGIKDRRYSKGVSARTEGWYRESWRAFEQVLTKASPETLSKSDFSPVVEALCRRGRSRAKGKKSKPQTHDPGPSRRRHYRFGISG
jgi:hypothetical protein